MVRYGMNLGWKDMIGRILILPATLLLMVPFSLGANEPGTYVLQGRADDGGLFTDKRVTVRVSRPVL